MATDAAIASETHGSTSAARPGAGPPRSIRQLNALLVNQIAAGEVIERPASVVKELVENSLDAGATRIAVELESGGIDLVRVADDGAGIAADELALALSPHATSKVAEAEDLDRIATMGFRGEALASIASVARVKIVSRREGAEGAEINAEGGPPGDVRPAAGPIGTRIEVRNLFFNTPARRKFLRAPATELTRCLDWLRDLALAHPGVGFTVRAGGSTRLELAPNQTPRERALAVLGRELEDQLLEVSIDRFDDARGVLVWGLIGTPAVARGTAKAQHVFLNGRTIRDKTIQHALREAYRGLIEPGRHPTALLMIEMDPSAVDVNVHPAKLEVRFRDQSMIHSAVLRGVREALDRADLTPMAAHKMPSGWSGGHGVGEHAGSGGDAGPARPLIGWGGLGEERAIMPGIEHPVDRSAREFAERLAAGEQVRPHPAWQPKPAPTHAESAHELTTPAITARRVERVLQVHDSYLVVEDDAGLLLIDQHALHERVMFERLLARITGADDDDAAPLESQRLLVPAVIEAGPAAVDALDGLRPLLAKLGVELEPMGPATIACHAIPTLLVSRGVDPADFTEDLLAAAERDGFAPGSEQALHEVLDMMACKAAVKAGDYLTDDEIAELLAQRERVERSGSCPHGRATTVRLSLAELERLFDRR